MKVIPGRYKEETAIEKWLKFKNAEYRLCNLVFLRRLAALCRDHNHAMNDLIGFRNVELQKGLYSEDLKANNGKPSGKVAKPGNSWHNYGFAADLDGDYWHKISEQLWLNHSRRQQEINSYGLTLPLNLVDSPDVVEWWHLQPLETLGYPGDRSKYAEHDDAVYGKPDVMSIGHRGIWVTELCRLLGTSLRLVFDQDLEQKVISVQNEGHLTADGIVDANTWTYLYKNLKS